MARFGFLASIISTAIALAAVQAAPSSNLGESAEGLSPLARDVLLTARAVPSSPVWLTYFDRYITYTGLPAVSDLTGFNVFALSFVYAASQVDNAVIWAELDSATRASIKAEYAAAGISLIVSAFGAGPTPTSSGDDPTAAAEYIANYVLTYGLDGVDIDYEDFGAVETAGTAVAWLTTLTKALRAQLPVGQYILTHAPVAPWFSPNLWPDNGYLGVNSAVGDLIDWYNIQFYNQGVTEYTTCAGLLTASSSTWPESAVFQIAANGVPLNKIVIGKPATTADSTNGWMDPGILATCLATAKAQGWSGGAMSWQYPDSTSAWITEVRADSWPVGSSSGGGTTTTTATTTATTTTKTTTSTTTTTTSTGGGGCTGAATWVASAAYPAGSVVTLNGVLWTANQWNEDEIPGGSSGAWDQTSTCNGGLVPATVAPWTSAKAIATTAA